MKSFIKNIQKNNRKALETVKAKIKDNNIDKHLNELAKNTAGVAGKLQAAGTTTLDVLTRQNVDAAVREHILIQGNYNDLIAMKLHEALERITQLEKKAKE